MTSFNFNYGPRLRSAPGAAAAIAELVSADRVLFATDGGVRGLGLCDAPLAGLRAAGCDVVICDAVDAGPSAATVLAAVEAGRHAGAVVGFGGGSPMDVAKVAAYLIGSGDDLDAIYGVEQAKGRGLPLLLVPTTAGTGSEATPISVITVG